MKKLLLTIGFLGCAVLGYAQQADTKPTVVTCEIRYIELPRVDANHLVPNTGYVMKPELLQQLQKLVDDKKATIQAQPRIATLSGVTVQIKTVREMIYPVSFDQGPPVGSGPVPSLTNSPYPYPIDFKVRELGVILNYTPTVSADGKMINVVLAPEISQLSKLGFVPHEVVSPSGKVEVKVPDFNDWSLSTSVVMKSGTTILLGVHDSVSTDQYPVPQDVVLVLLTVTVNPIE